MDNNEPLISVVIPVKNGARTIEACLDALFNQSIIKKCEIIVIDSGSKDGTLNLLKNYQIKLYTIPPHEFNHGATRNYGVTLAEGQFVYFTVQDAVAFDNTMLERMVGHFSNDRIMAVAGRQAVPHDKDKNPHQWFRPISTPKSEKYEFKSETDFNSLPDSQKRWVCGLDDVNALYRKEALQKLPFRNLQFAEDMVWASDGYKKGFAIVIDSTARVYHYHHQTYSFAKRVTMFCAYAEWTCLGIFPKPVFNLRDYFFIIYRNLKFGANPKWIINQFGLLLAQYHGLKTIRKIITNGEIDNFNQSNYALYVPQGEQSKKHKIATSNK